MLCSDKGVSNHWAGICNETIQLKMEWNSERTQLQLTCATRDHIHYISGVTGTAQLSSVSLGLLSHRISKFMPTACKHGTVASSSSGALLF